MSKSEFWESNPREIWALLTHYGIENGAYKTKSSIKEEQKQKWNSFFNLAKKG